MATSAKQIATSLMYYETRLDRQLTRAYRLLNHLQLMQASQSPPNLLSELKNTQNDPISTTTGPYA